MYRLSKQECEFRERMRGRYPLDPKWYALMTHCGRERQVRDKVLLGFSDDGVGEVLLPELKARRKAANGKSNLPELLFSSYVFLHCRMNDELYMTVSAYSDVFSVLGRAYRIPHIIDDTEIIHLKGVLASHPVPTLSPRLNVGAGAVVTRGLMEGVQGRVVEFNSHFAKLETYFSFFDNGTSIIVVVPRSDIRLAETELSNLPGNVATRNLQKREG